MNSDDIRLFIVDCEKIYRTGSATEHSYRPSFKTLFEKNSGIIPVNEPKQSENGKPDFIFKKKDNPEIIIAYAEMKDPGKDLDEVETTEQWERYKKYANIFLTDDFEWRFYNKGKEYSRFVIADFDAKKGTISPREENYEALANQLNYYFANSIESVTNGQRLAEIMGNRARIIRDKLLSNVIDGQIGNKDIRGLYNMFRQMLVEDLSIDSFADMYAQTLVYGLFIARYNDTTIESFSRSEARELIPNSNPLLRDFFDHIAGATFDPDLKPIVDNLCQVYSVCDVRYVVSRHVNNDVNDYRDPIIHFYEDFLKSYDPELKEKMGAYYTPTPIVNYIIKAVDKHLKDDFRIRDGISSSETTQITYRVNEGFKKGKGTGKKIYFEETKTIPKVQILDPAVGTATFLNETIRYIYQERFSHNAGIWGDYVNNNLVKRLNGFEIMMTPYTIAHLKLGMTLQSLGAVLPDERLRVFLTNTLTEGVKRDLPLYEMFGLAQAVSDESELAAEVKNDYPVMIIIGNPPYSGESSNQGQFAMNLVDKYKWEPGGTIRLQERNPKWINDDYVKFIAFSEEMITKNGTGIVAMITNHKYLVNPTFRGMRWHLLSSFDKIYVIDLHGNISEGERAPDGSRDENVFDNIQQGVAIMVAIKTSDSTDLGSVYHAEIFGSRKQKFSALIEGSIDFTDVVLDERMYYFVPRSLVGQDAYNSFVPLNKLMPLNSVAVVTGNDPVLMDDSVEGLLDKIEYHKSNGQDKTAHRLQQTEIDADKIIPIAYRLFDKRFIYYDTDVVERSRSKVMSSLIGNGDNSNVPTNYSVVFKRGLSERNVPPIHIADCVSESRFWSRSGMQGIDYVAPLYVRNKDNTYVPNFDEEYYDDLFSEIDDDGLANVTPESVLYYIYASLHSRNYCKNYYEFFSMDFPCVPRPKEWDMYWHLVEIGKQIVNLHLMRESIETGVTYPETGNNRVDSIKFDNNRVYINKTQFFDNVPDSAWNTMIGGYYPARNYLKVRKGKLLSFDELEHYEQIIAVLIEHNRLIASIDGGDNG